MLLGAWLAGSAFMSIVASQNFRSVDRLMNHSAPEVRSAVQALGGIESARLLLRHHVSEQNRWYYDSWEIVQLIGGLALFLLLLFGTLETKFTLLLPLMMIACVAVCHFVLTPEITTLGRLLDFSAMPLADSRRLWMMERTYTVFTAAEWALGLVLAVKLLLRSRRHSRQATGQVDMVDAADYGHVNR